MPGERFVLLGLAEPRSPWFRDVAQWVTSASLPAEFVKCVSAEEVRARLVSGRPHSALLVDATLPAFDRDLVAAATAASTPVLAVVDGQGPTWSAADLGVAATMPSTFSPTDLLDQLASHARMIGRADRLPPALHEEPAGTWMGQLIAVCGPGGTGASTVAIGLAQAIAADPRSGRRVLLADLARRADQAMLHDSRELGPGVQELIEAHRLGRPGADQVRRFTFDVPTRGYRLLLGLRQPQGWAALRPRATDAAVAGLRRAFQVVVADVTGDVEGEAQSGSADVEERNHLSRTVALTADSVFAVGTPTMKGVHSLAWLVRSLAEAGVEPARILPVINRAPRGPRARADLARTLSEMAGDKFRGVGVLFLPERKMEDAHRDGRPLPEQFVRPLAGAARAHLDRNADAPPPAAGPTPISPGSLGSWTEQDHQ